MQFSGTACSPLGCEGQAIQACALQAAAVNAGVQMCAQAPFREMLVTRVKLEGGGHRGVHQLVCLWGDVASLHRKPDPQAAASELGRRTPFGQGLGAARVCLSPGGSLQGLLPAQ